MNSELKSQLDTLIKQSMENESRESYEDQEAKNENRYFDNDHIANDTMKQLEAIIKQEPSDDNNDDDFYYVLVIDDQEKENTEEKGKTEVFPELVQNIKQEVNNDREKVLFTMKEEAPKENFDKNCYDSFLLSNTKVPVNVPDTILENEETQDYEDDHFHNAMDIDETQDSTSQDQHLTEVEDSQDQNYEVQITGNINDVSNKNNILKILSSTGADGTIMLKSQDGIQYLTSTQLVTSEDGDPSNQEEVIFCEGDSDSQFQILKCDGSELVIEYADGDQITTVLQQEDGTFLCDCGEQFDDLAEYEKHQYKHNPAGEHLCSMCGKGFESAEILSGHMLLHSVSGMLVNCPFCDTLVKRNGLTQHIKYGHNNIKPQCNICTKTFANPNNLKRHMMIHSGVRLFECDICFKRFHQKITMQTHRLTHINNQLSCSHCVTTFETKEALDEHKESSECSKSRALKVKQELMKTLKQEITTNLGKLLGYACSLCKKMFSLESALETHVESTHMIDPSELLCSECGEVLPSKFEMQNHILTHNKIAKPKNIKRFECGICGKACSSQAMLVMHERVHTNERPYPCGLCSLRFKTKTHLRTHQLTHTREKKFGCSVCMKFFALKGNLVVHLRTHTGERPYVCSICNEAFIDSKYLKKHKLKKHALENRPWNKY